MNSYLLLFSVLVCLTTFAFAAEEDVQAGELSFDYSDGRWGLRAVNVGQWSIAGLWSGAWFHSVQADVDTKQPTVNGDYMWGSIYNGFLTSVPLAYFAYFDASASAERNISDPSKVNWTKFDVSVSSSFMASAFITLIERDEAGADVQEVKLNLLGWGYDAAESDSLTNKTAGLYAFVFNGNRIVGWPKVSLQYIITQIAGELNAYNGVSVYPKSLESVVMIDDWRYKNNSNHLVLKVALGSLQGSWTSEGQLSAGSGSGKVYFHLEKEAIINGVISPVKIGAAVNASADFAFSNPDITFQLNSKYHADASCQIIEVAFPAGATSIVYDPTMGSGDSPFEPVPPNQSNILPIVLGVVGASVVVLIVIVVILYYGNRRGYSSVA